MPEPRTEKDLYEPLRSWIKKNQLMNYDIAPGSGKGLKEVQPDLTGIKHIGSYLRGDFELMAMEVKMSRAGFVKSAGQASAYRLFADRVYLACYLNNDGPFTDDEIDMAGHLGIGLVSVTYGGKNLVNKRTLKAPEHFPIPRKRQRLLENLGYVICQFCEILFSASASPEKLTLKTSHIGGPGSGRRYMCPDCKESVFGDVTMTKEDLKNVSKRLSELINSLTWTMPDMRNTLKNISSKLG